MKKLIQISIVTVAVLIASCATVQKNMPFVEYEAYAAAKAVLLLAVNDADREDVKADLFAVATALYSVTGGQVGTPEDLQNALKLVTPKSKEWADLVGELVKIWADWFPSIKGNPATALQLANKINAGVIRATRPPVATTSP